MAQSIEFVADDTTKSNAMLGNNNLRRSTPARMHKRLSSPLLNPGGILHNGEVGAPSNQETRPCEISPRLVVASDSQPPPTGRKRKRSILTSKHRNTQSELSVLPEPQVKRQRFPGKSSSNSSTNSSTDSSWSNWDRVEREYWDSLSKLRLTSNALRELNRRNALLRTETPPDEDASVTREQHPADITRFARHGGPDLSGIRNHPDLETVSSTSDPMPQTRKGKAKSGQKPHSKVEKGEKRSSAYDGNFEQHLVDNNVFPASRAQRATNHAEWDEVLIWPRASPSRSSDASYKSFVKAVEGARDEGEVMTKAFPKIIGNSRYASGQNVSFGHLEQITKKIVIPQPDWYQGEIPGEGNRTLRERLDKAIVPSTRKDRAFLPTYFAEAKGPEGSYAVARRQACHDGALGARAMHSLQSLGGTESYDGRAHVASAIYHGEGDLKLFTHHMTQPRGPGTLSHTHMTPLMSYNLMNSPRSFRETRTAFRNVSDKAHEYRVQFIDDANRRNGIVSPPPPTSVPRSTRKPLSCQAPIVESSDSDTDSDTSLSSEGEATDDDDHSQRSGARSQDTILKPKLMAATSKRPAKKSPSPRLRPLRRRVDELGDLDSDSSPRQARKPKVVTISPGRITRGDPFARRNLRPRE